MALCNRRILLLQTPKVVSRFDAVITVYVLLAFPYLASCLHFDFPNFDSPYYASIITEGDAYPDPAEKSIQLSSTEPWGQIGSVGRVRYNEALHLWDRVSNNLTDFTTHFSFSITSDDPQPSYGVPPPFYGFPPPIYGVPRPNPLPNPRPIQLPKPRPIPQPNPRPIYPPPIYGVPPRIYGYGLAFFLQPIGTTLPPDSGGRYLGLVSDAGQQNTNGNHFVAVEFDTFANPPSGPLGDHVGVDVNSLKALQNTSWCNDTPRAKTNEAWVSYNSSTHNLSVTFTCMYSGFVPGTYNGSVSAIVDLRKYLPEYVQFGFSASTANSLTKIKILSWSFNSTVADKVPDRSNDTIPEVVESLRDTSNKKMPVIIGSSVAAAFFAVCGLFWFFVMRRRKNEEEEEVHVLEGFSEDELEKDTGPKKFSYYDLAGATNRFEEKLGEGGFGGVYKGFLKGIDKHVAVKRVSRGSMQGIKEYAAEVKIISKLRHRNLVQLIGWCHEKKELLLVYEFLQNGSLDHHLFKEKSLLTWEVRYNIAKGLASGLLYLHEEWEQCVVHRDIKSSNVMLDSDFNAKLGDFGLARLVDHGKGSQTTVLAGTMGYMAPECTVTGKASKESDVYSFGIVCLEISCGRKPINYAADKGQEILVRWVWDLYGTGKLTEAADPKLQGEFDVQLMERLMITGLWCAHPDESLRPSIRQVTHVLNFEAPLPILPSKMSVLTYFAPPISESMLLRSCTATDSDASKNPSSTTNSSQLSSFSIATSQSAPTLFLHTR